MAQEALIKEEEVASTIEQVLKAGVALLTKEEEFTESDYAKLKVMRTMGSHVSNAVILVQQRTARDRHIIVRERMKKMGYGTGLKQIPQK